MNRVRAFIVTTALSFPMAAPVGAASAEPLYQALLKTTPANLPPGYTSASASEISAAKEPGFIGEVDLTFKGGDPKARVGFFVFSDFNSASEFNRKHLPPFTRGQKLLAFPPMARCINAPDGTGYCDMWIQDQNVIMTAAASKIDGAADALMGFGFRYLNSISQGAARQPFPHRNLAILLRARLSLRRKWRARSGSM